MKYVGEELELFQHARNWKRYYTGFLRPYVRGRVLDASCGMGVNADLLYNEQVTTYTFLEPDLDLLNAVPKNVTTAALRNSERLHGTTVQLDGRKFDTILYLDVIEHIEDSKAELQRAYDLLAPGGHLLILVPAFNSLYSAFDRAIGHFRRYDEPMLRAELPTGLDVLDMRYLDALGTSLSLANKWFLKRSTPSRGQLHFWDRVIIPVSRMIDVLVGHRFGRSLLCIAHKPSA